MTNIRPNLALTIDKPAALGDVAKLGWGTDYTFDDIQATSQADQRYVQGRVIPTGSGWHYERVLFLPGLGGVIPIPYVAWADMAVTDWTLSGAAANWAVTYPTGQMQGKAFLESLNGSGTVTAESTGTLPGAYGSIAIALGLSAPRAGLANMRVTLNAAGAADQRVVLNFDQHGGVVTGHVPYLQIGSRTKVKMQDLPKLAAADKPQEFRWHLLRIFQIDAHLVVLMDDQPVPFVHYLGDTFSSGHIPQGTLKLEFSNRTWAFNASLLMSDTSTTTYVQRKSPFSKSAIFNSTEDAGSPHFFRWQPSGTDISHSNVGGAAGIQDRYTFSTVSNPTLFPCLYRTQHFSLTTLSTADSAPLDITGLLDTPSPIVITERLLRGHEVEFVVEDPSAAAQTKLRAGAKVDLSFAWATSSAPDPAKTVLAKDFWLALPKPGRDGKGQLPGAAYWSCRAHDWLELMLGFKCLKLRSFGGHSFSTAFQELCRYCGIPAANISVSGVDPTLPGTRGDIRLQFSSNMTVPAALDLLCKVVGKEWGINIATGVVYARDLSSYGGAPDYSIDQSDAGSDMIEVIDLDEAPTEHANLVYAAGMDAQGNRDEKIAWHQNAGGDPVWTDPTHAAYAKLRMATDQDAENQNVALVAKQSLARRIRHRLMITWSREADPAKSVGDFVQVTNIDDMRITDNSIWEVVEARREIRADAQNAIDTFVARFIQ